MKKILIVPGNLFVSRNYFSSPLIENLKRISIKDNIKIIVAEVEGNPINEDVCTAGDHPERCAGKYQPYY